MFIFTPHTALKANVFIGHRIQNVGGGGGLDETKRKYYRLKRNGYRDLLYEKSILESTSK